MTQSFPPPHFQYVKSALQGLLFQGEHIPFPDCGSIGTLSQVPGLTEARILTGVTDQLFSPENPSRMLCSTSSFPVNSERYIAALHIFRIHASHLEAPLHI